MIWIDHSPQAISFHSVPLLYHQGHRHRPGPLEPNFEELLAPDLMVKAEPLDNRLFPAAAMPTALEMPLVAVEAVVETLLRCNPALVVAAVT